LREYLQSGRVLGQECSWIEWTLLPPLTPLVGPRSQFHVPSGGIFLEFYFTFFLSLNFSFFSDLILIDFFTDLHSFFSDFRILFRLEKFLFYNWCKKVRFLTQFCVLFSHLLQKIAYNACKKLQNDYSCHSALFHPSCIIYYFQTCTSVQTCFFSGPLLSAKNMRSKKYESQNKN